LPVKLSQMAFLRLGLSVIILLTGCSNLANRVTDTEVAQYLTPISEETLEAFQEGIPIENEQQAVIAARVYLDSTRIRFTTHPEVVSVVEEPLNAWKVVFEGDYQINPPDPMHTLTPPAPVHGCVFVAIDTNANVRTEVGTIGCPP